jgi:hypothetical protein
LPLVVVAIGWAAWSPVRRYVGLAEPAQYHRAIDAAAVRGHGIFAVAHNAGDNPTTAARALRHGAAVVEIDVIWAGGTLVAGREQRPLPWLAEALFQGPTLTDIWNRTPTGTAVLLDLKETDRELLDALVGYLRPRLAQRDVMISSRDPAALRYVHARLSGPDLLYTLAWPDDVARFERSPALVDLVDGVSGYEGLLDAGLVSRLRAHDLTVVAWPVNDGARLRALADAGVDGVTTDNLAVIDALRAP